MAQLAAAASLALVSPSAAGDTLTALGRVLPRSGIVDLAGVPGDTVVSVNVKEGDWVDAGQSLATLSSAQQAAKGLADAEAALEATRASGSRDVEVAQASASAAETEASFAKERYDRMYAARNSEFISPDQLSDRTVAMGTANVKLLQARQDLEKARRGAEKAVRAAEADVRAARAQLSLAEVRSPIRARVLKTLARVGSSSGRGELFKLGDTSSMVVVAEIYEDDVLKVKPGQKATVSSVALPGKMTGEVSSVSSLIYRNSLESLDPNQSSQTRIVEVTILMDQASPLDHLVLLQVDVSIGI
jgi:HlyD family secretion protein